MEEDKTARESSIKDDSSLLIDMNQVDLEAIIRYAEQNFLKTPTDPRYEKRNDRFKWLLTKKRFIIPFLSNSERWIRRLLFFFLLLLLLSVTILGPVALYFSGGFSKSKKVVAYLTKAEGAIWGDLLKMPERGGLIYDGSLKLLDGIVSIRLIEGAEILLEGPAEIVFESTSKLKLASGYLSADVPPQPEPLLIETPQMIVKVLGTSFWIRAEQDKTDVHLVRGKLELDSPTFGCFQLVTNEAFSLSEVGVSKRFEAALDYFVPPTLFDRQSVEIDKRRREKWTKASKSINIRKDLLVRFDFEHSEGNRLENLAQAGKACLDNALIIDCQTGMGRWPDKKALIFDGVSSRIAFSLPGGFDGLTLIASLRVDTIEHVYNGIMMSNAENSQFGMGRVHWQITDKGYMRTGLGAQGSKNLVSTNSPIVLKSSDLGRWFHFALSINAKTGRVEQYINGRRISSERLPLVFKPEIGDANLGFWLPEGDKPGTRGFKGAIDEFMIFNRELTSEEIRNICYH